MLLPKFAFHEPASVDEACEIMDTFGAKAKLIAGGTDLMVNMKKKILAPEHLVCLGRIDAMHGIAEDGDHIIIGGRYTVAELAVDSLVEKKLSALQSGARASAHRWCATGRPSPAISDPPGPRPTCRPR